MLRDFAVLAPDLGDGDLVNSTAAAPSPSEVDRLARRAAALHRRSLSHARLHPIMARACHICSTPPPLWSCSEPCGRSTSANYAPQNLTLMRLDSDLATLQAPPTS